MTVELERIVAKIEADTAGLRTDLDKARREFSDFSNKTTSGVGRVTAGFKSLIGVVGGFALLSSIKRLGLAALDTVASFEDLQDSLGVVFGGLEQGEAAFQRILRVTAETPFQIQDVTRAFITLQASGITPTTELMRTFSDTASVTTDRIATFNALVRVMSRSVGGGLGLEELNQIADRGIPVWRIFKEEMGKNRLELGEVGKTAAGAKRLMDALITGLNKRFGGATENALDNISVATSNFSDALAALIAQLSDFTGAGTGFADLVNFATDNMVRWRLELALIEKEGVSGLIALREATLGTAIGISISAKAWEAYDKALQEAILGAELAAEGQENLGNGISEMQEKLREARKELEFETAQLQRTAEDQMLYNIAKEEGIENTQDFIDALRPYVQQLLRAEEAHEELQEALEREQEAEDAVKEAAQELVKTYKDLWTETRTAKETFDDTVLTLEILEEKLRAIGVAGPDVAETFRRAREEAKLTFEEAEKAGTEMADVMEDVGFTFQSAFEDAVVSGQNLSTIIDSLVQDLIRLTLRAVILKPLIESLFGGGSSGDDGLLTNFFGSIFGAAASAGSGQLVGGSGSDVITLANAKGNAFTGGRVVPFAKGGVVSEPTMFPMPRGVGIMSEKSGTDEGVLPLARTRSGDLGVHAAGIGGGGARVEVNVFAPPGSMVDEERDRVDNLDRINLFIDRSTAQNMKPGTQTFRALQSRFGVGQQVTQR